MVAGAEVLVRIVVIGLEAVVSVKSEEAMIASGRHLEYFMSEGTHA